ncbi:MAG: CSLREA domain-containing protein [Pyrinomonadaceae bacterium]|nr:CSLREA domain-containing protein [Pyrinomonadaceae bacterium]
MRRFVKGSIIAALICLASGIASAATFTVTKTADTNDGICDTDCSLREAVQAANTAAGDDIINFDPMVFGSAQTVSITLGEIIFGANGTLTINGTGANLLTIDGNLSSRIFKTAAGVAATINDLTLTRGNGVGSVASNSGGAIYNDLGTLTLNRVVVTGNTATNGGGIRNSGSGSVLNINESVISSNTATTSSGGGMQNFSSSTVNINNSTFVGNTSGGTTGGGGAQFNGIVRITNSTFANNTAPNGSGGGFHSNGSNQIITNSTFSGNSSGNNGGGIHRGTTNVNFFIRNCIVAGNNGVSTSPDITNSTNGIDSEGNNIIGNVGTSTGWETSDLLNIDPMLGMLADNGGPTQTMLPMSGSPAIDGGQNCVLDLSCATNNPPQAVVTDQRGTTRPSGANVDIGSVEVAATSASVSGKLQTSTGSPIDRVIVVLTETSMTAAGTTFTVSATTNSFGNFSIPDVPTGRTYSVTVLSKQFVFCPTSITVNADVTNLNLTPDSENLAGSKLFGGQRAGCFK